MTPRLADEVRTRICGSAARRSGESGTVMLLALGMVAITVALIAVVTDVSSLWLSRRALNDAADAAALAAAQAVDLAAVYGGQTTHTSDGVDVLPLDRNQVSTRVLRYVKDVRLATVFSHFQVISVRSDGDSVVVVFKARSKPPFMSVLADLTASDGVDIIAEAHARLALN